MYNLVYLIGRLTAEPELKNLENDKQVLTANIAVQRSYKNADGVYDADFIKCVLWDGITERTSEYCQKGDLVALRGQIRTSSFLNKKGEKEYATEIVVDKIAFLGPKNYEKEDVESSNISI